MKPPLLLIILICLHSGNVYSQQPRFNLIKSGEENGWGTIADITQDPQGYIWLSTQLKGIQRYDGTNLISYSHDPRNPNSISNNRVPCIQSDSSGIIWAGTFGGGLEKFDPVKNKFTHYRHDPKDQYSLANDTVFSLLVDHLGNLWAGTWSGLDMLDQKTGKFTHYRNNPRDPSTLSYDRVWILYEDKKGTIWVGCGSAFMSPPEKLEDGGLNQFDRSTGKFTRFLHDPLDPNSIENNKVRAILEDSKGNLWVGTAGDGLHILDRKSKRFTHYHYDAKHPDQLSRPRIVPSGFQGFIIDFITFIREDSSGSIWIGSLGGGINKYDPVSRKITHFGYEMTDNNSFSAKDTSSGFNEMATWRAFCARDGLFWVTTASGNLFNINPAKKTIPYYQLSQKEANSFYLDMAANELWIGTSKGLLSKNRVTGVEKRWSHDAQDPHSISNDYISVLRQDKKGLLWIGTIGGGVSAFNSSTGIFKTYVHDEKNKGSLGSNNVNALYHDHENNLWIGMDTALDKLNKSTGTITHIFLDPDRKQNLFLSGNLSPNGVFCFAEDSHGYLWMGGISLYRFDHNAGKFNNYLQNALIINLCVDAEGTVWAATPEGLYKFDATQDKFSIFSDSVSHISIDGIIHILSDNNNNLWVSTDDEIIRIDKRRDKIQKYGELYGVHKNTFTAADNFKAANGELFFGDQGGYYDFFPEQVNDLNRGPFITLTGFKIGDQEMTHAEGTVLKSPLWQTNQIELNYKQNVFSFDFFAFDYINRQPKRYQFMLENYNNEWLNIGSEHKAYFFGVPPGKYVFHIRAINTDGSRSEKALNIIITPPWWRTWWAYTIFTLSFIGAVWAFIYYRSSKLRRENRRLEERVAQRTEELSHSLQNLRSAQSLLIQSEKMASLGELTAGIAHEIQNPLNFVNNFSEVSAELLAELKEGPFQHLPLESKAAANEIVEDLTINLEKINHHGKRADAIVKGMLQHSRSSAGNKEPSDLNALVAEWLRLSYQGIRSKDKSFQSTIQTDFDESVGKINVIPQDIGRVLLNLYNNAFYAVSEKKKQSSEIYEPTVSVTTKKVNGKIEISVRDNGNGIPQKILDKIFQPFFTTKPTGQGTGLGLSLAYDIVKAHGGELRVETKETEGSEFIIELPLT